MFIHHMTTIGLMVLSWSVNLTRVGTLVLLIHDCADIFLEVRELRELEFRQLPGVPSVPRLGWVDILSVPLYVRLCLGKVNFGRSGFGS